MIPIKCGTDVVALYDELFHAADITTRKKFTKQNSMNAEWWNRINLK